jgi:hypothetical protein
LEAQTCYSTENSEEPPRNKNSPVNLLNIQKFDGFMLKPGMACGIIGRL